MYASISYCHLKFNIDYFVCYLLLVTQCCTDSGNINLRSTTPKDTVQSQLVLQQVMVFKLILKKIILFLETCFLPQKNKTEQPVLQRTLSAFNCMSQQLAVFGSRAVVSEQQWITPPLRALQPDDLRDDFQIL